MQAPGAGEEAPVVELTLAPAESGEAPAMESSTESAAPTDPSEPRTPTDDVAASGEKAPDTDSDAGEEDAEPAPLPPIKVLSAIVDGQSESLSIPTINFGAEPPNTADAEKQLEPGRRPRHTVRQNRKIPLRA